MAVKSLGWLAAAAVWLPAASGMAREQPFARSPLQTAGPELKLGGIHTTPPTVTARPAARDLLQKRDTNTCGFVDGNQASSYVCLASDAQCLYDDRNLAVGCCLTTSCSVYIGCLPYTASAATKTYNSDRTTYCSNSDLPSCAVFSYADPSGSLSGYTIRTCDSTSTTYTMFFKPTPSSKSSSSKSSASSSASSSGASSGTPSATASDDGNRSPAETSGGAAAGGKSSTPVGPIVGGVVGGLAGLGLLGVGVWFLLRRNKTHQPISPAMTTATATTGAGPPGGPAGFMGGPPGGPHGHSPYGNPQYGNQTPPQNPAALGVGAAYDPYDPRHSMAQTQHSPNMSISPGGSPSPVYHQQMPSYAQQQQAMGMGMGMGGTGTPPPQQYGMGTPPPQMGMGTPPPQGQQNAGYYGKPPVQQSPPPVELPTQRGDGPVHELS